MCSFLTQKRTDNRLGQCLLWCFGRYLPHFQVYLPGKLATLPLLLTFYAIWTSIIWVKTIFFTPYHEVKPELSAFDSSALRKVLTYRVIMFRCWLRHYLDFWLPPLIGTQRVPSQTNMPWTVFCRLLLSCRESFQFKRRRKTHPFPMLFYWRLNTLYYGRYFLSPVQWFVLSYCSSVLMKANFSVYFWILPERIFQRLILVHWWAFHVASPTLRLIRFITISF